MFICICPLAKPTAMKGFVCVAFEEKTLTGNVIVIFFIISAAASPSVLTSLWSGLGMTPTLPSYWGESRRTAQVNFTFPVLPILL